MRISGHVIGEAAVNRIRRIQEENPGLTRRGLSRKVCEEFGFESLNGRYQEVSCRKALLELERRGELRLPEASEYCFRAKTEKAAGGGKEKAAIEAPEVECELIELGELKVKPVSNRQESQIWNEIMSRHHYLGKGPLCGAQIRYLVESTEYGYIGGLSYSGSHWRLKACDEYIGWSEGARHRHLNEVVCNSRFLILPTVRVRNLASHVLSRSLQRLRGDWQDRYGYEPALVETFVDTSRYSGTCYQAANWQHVGETAGAGNVYPNGKKSEGRKAIYLYPLIEGWQARLCHEEAKPLGSLERSNGFADWDWTEEEFGRVEFYDDRLRARLFRLAAAFHEQPGELIPMICKGGKAEIKAAYRFFKNKNVNMQRLLRPHIESTIDRVRAHKVVLAVQDTTSLNYTAHAPDGAGPIGNKVAVGFELHDTMAFTPEGVPLGLLNLQCWARDAEETGKKQKRHKLPIEEKESRKWLDSYRAVAEIQKSCPETMLVSVGDREADMYELFYEVMQTLDGPEFLVRSSQGRNRKVATEDDTKGLWDKMAAAPAAGIMEVSLPRRGSRPARIAKLQVSHAEEKLKPPAGSGFPEIDVWCVYARETGHGEEVKEPLEWMLLTSVRTESFEQACDRLNWYGRRWGIEVYHRILKSGCRIEDRRLSDADSLKSCLAIDLVVGWRVYWFTMVGRDNPDEPCDKILGEDEWRVLCIWATQKLPETVPSVKQAMHWIGRMGGWMKRGETDNPGTTCMWRGLARLPGMALGYRLALDHHGLRPGP